MASLYPEETSSPKQSTSLNASIGDYSRDQCTDVFMIPQNGSIINISSNRTSLQIPHMVTMSSRTEKGKYCSDNDSEMTKKEIESVSLLSYKTGSNHMCFNSTSCQLLTQECKNNSQKLFSTCNTVTDQLIMSIVATLKNATENNDEVSSLIYIYIYIYVILKINNAVLLESKTVFNVLVLLYYYVTVRIEHTCIRYCYYFMYYKYAI